MSFRKTALSCLPGQWRWRSFRYRSGETVNGTSELHLHGGYWLSAMRCDDRHAAEVHFDRLSKVHAAFERKFPIARMSTASTCSPNGRYAFHREVCVQPEIALFVMHKCRLPRGSKDSGSLGGASRARWRDVQGSRLGGEGRCTDNHHLSPVSPPKQSRAFRFTFVVIRCLPYQTSLSLAHTRYYFFGHIA